MTGTKEYTTVNIHKGGSTLRATPALSDRDRSIPHEDQQTEPQVSMEDAWQQIMPTALCK